MRLNLSIGAEDHEVEIQGTGDELTVRLDGEESSIDARSLGEGSYGLIVDGRSVPAVVEEIGDGYRVWLSGRPVDVLRTDRLGAAGGAGGGGHASGQVTASMPGKVVRILVAEGDAVEAGQGLMVVEAMKMENQIDSPIAGVVKRVTVAPGETVETGAEMILVESAD